MMRKSRFSVDDIPKLDGKNIIITGANVGLGFVTALECARKGAHITLACRSQGRAESAMCDIKTQFPDAKLEFLALDLQDMKQTKEAAEKWLSKGLPLHVLVNNAGIMAPPFSKTKDGIESQFGTNHIGHFVFTLTLLPRIIESQPSRIVNLASVGHNFTPTRYFANGFIPLDVINDETKLGIWERYGISKLSNILFTLELNRKLKDHKVYCNSCHPGFVATELMRGPVASYGSLMGTMNKIYEAFFTVKPEIGARTQIYLATSGEVERKSIRGLYLVPTAKIRPPSKLGQRKELAAELWDMSMNIVSGTGIQLPSI
ncbi:hypothetical protein SeMB42_g02610 [Synchytrium endobioticum]|uniref:Uncharacterized protein n=1 Tax=Synchytrium endobioticum TaxID=286115 RepID=A0A507CZA3_9FUNG|nr:hypothetical protein SeLEV6574_g04621 [Synchytrium endobioticum]TPX49388.1 hypothetical protein SeMB42_g02610 [Synchytrium endobioticum]